MLNSFRDTVLQLIENNKNVDKVQAAIIHCITCSGYTVFL